MRRLTMHLLVALVAFGVGVTTATLLGGLFGRRAPEQRLRGVRVERVVRTEVREHRRACPSSRGWSELPAPPPMPSMPPMPESAPMPPDAPHAGSPRIVIQRADGTAVRVIEPGDTRAR